MLELHKKLMPKYNHARAVGGALVSTIVSVDVLYHSAIAHQSLPMLGALFACMSVSVLALTSAVLTVHASQRLETAQPK